MQEKGKISSFQLYCLMFNFLIGSTIIMQSLTAAGRDTWISEILAVLAGAVMVLVYKRLACIFPNMTLIQYSQVIFGKYVGKLIAIIYLWFFLHLGVLVLRNFGEFLTNLVMPETPIWFFHVTLVLVCAWFICCGLEIMGRTSELIFPVNMLLIFLTIILVALSQVMDMKNFLPFLEHGTANILKGAFARASFPYLETVLFTMLFPFVNTVKNSKKAALWAVFSAGAVLLALLLQDISVFGENLATFSFPRYAVIRLISVGNFLDRIDPVVIAVWITTALVKVGVCLYAFVLGLAQILGMKDYKPLTKPAAALMAVLSILVYENTYEMLDFAINIWPVYAFPFEVGLPLLMLVLVSWRRLF
ncbi:GerAB/ArcD/ProY family transporter [Zhaonella formicivorans]|uniref:GerAB/ArcD/ProY family transporter n=1 Tax=Zhaonella formicivorans TaxID=2528593 RepID=UPI0010E77A7D|nr:endospore germination permease [Zhaonella formicivorans]